MITPSMGTAIGRVGVWARAGAALVTILAFAAGVPWLLLVMIGNPIPTDGWGWSQPLTNEALLGLIAVLAWVFWAQMMLCLVVEILAELRLAAGRSADWMTQIPGTFGGQQHLARVLVQAVVAIGIGASVAAVPPSAEVAHGTSARIAPAATVPRPAVASFDPAHANLKTNITRRARAATGSDSDRQETLSVEVVKGDTLWSIAERHLGSGELWRAIADLNESRLMPDGRPFVQASSIRPGWQLLIPAAGGLSATPRRVEVTVVPDDTLWGLAEQAYGDGEDWPRLYDANRGQLDDPDLIYPGQILNVPSHSDVASAHPGADPEPPDEAEHPGVAVKPHAGALEPATPGTTEAPDRLRPELETTPTIPEQTFEVPSVNAPDGVGDGRLTTALVGGGGLLAGGALAMFLAHRRTQSRNRRSGRTIASTPPKLVGAEATLRSTGSAGGVAARFLDRALRDLSSRLARSQAALPEVAAVRLADDRLDLYFATPPKAQPPMPWTDGVPEVGDREGRCWTLSREAPLEDSDALAPYPALVAIGTADDGATWLLDLEAAGLVQLIGDRPACENLARFMGADLALNVWSDDVDVTLAGFAEELVGLNRARLRQQELPDVSDLVKTIRRTREAMDTLGCDVLAGRLNGSGADTWMPKILLADAGAEPEHFRDDVERLLDELAIRPGRNAVALVTISVEPAVSTGPTLTLDRDGHFTLKQWDVKLTANQLTASEAQTLADLLAASEFAEDEPMPPATGAQPFEEVSDAAGALLVELTEPREGGPAPGSLLALPDHQYVTSAATTTTDLAALAPVVHKQARARILALDASLDDDLAAWYDADTPRPRLRLLGPVELRTSGQRTADVDRRCAYFTEVVAYLATRDHGATPEQVAEAFNVQTNTIHSRVGTVRKWLGTDPTTDNWYLPESTLSPSAKTRGVPVYEVVGLLSDAHLFKRLRVRGQARGPGGIEDLVLALRLVEGRPFDQLRPGGYGWLAETPLDQYFTAGVVDVAHIVATHALASDDVDLARWASEIAIAAAPSEDKPRLDFAAVMVAQRNEHEVQDHLTNAVFNRSEDGTAPPSPSGRTAEILKAKGWLHSAKGS